MDKRSRGGCAAAEVKPRMADENPTTPTPAPTPGAAPTGATPPAAAAQAAAAPAAATPPNADKPADAGTMASEALDAAGKAAEQLAEAATADQPRPVNLPEFNSASNTAGQPGGLAMLSEVNLQVKIELGRTRMLVEDVLRLTADSVIELDKLAGDPVDIFVKIGRASCRE